MGTKDLHIVPFLRSLTVPLPFDRISCIVLDVYAQYIELDMSFGVIER